MRKVTFPFLKTLVIVFGVLLPATNVAFAQVPISLPHIVARAGTTRTIDVTACYINSLCRTIPIIL